MPLIKKKCLICDKNIESDKLFCPKCYKKEDIFKKLKAFKEKGEILKTNRYTRRYHSKHLEKFNENE